MTKDDLISRQAAIDALNGEINTTGRANAEAVRGYVRLVKDRLERLPSAQPQLPEWAKKAEEYRQSAPQHIHNPLAWPLYQVWKEIDED